jgi:hypothetical protein
MHLHIAVAEPWYIFANCRTLVHELRSVIKLKISSYPSLLKICPFPAEDYKNPLARMHIAEPPLRR